MNDSKPLTIERRVIGELSEDPANVRKHGTRNLDAIKASLRRFGQQKPIVVTQEGTVIAGNGTLAAAKDLGWTHIEVAVTELSGTDIAAFAIADNRTAELATWDHQALNRTLAAIADAETDDSVEELGFAPSVLAAFKQRQRAEDAMAQEAETNAGAASLLGDDDYADSMADGSNLPSLSEASDPDPYANDEANGVERVSRPLTMTLVVGPDEMADIEAAADLFRQGKDGMTRDASLVGIVQDWLASQTAKKA